MWLTLMSDFSQTVYRPIISWKLPNARVQMGCSFHSCRPCGPKSMPKWSKNASRWPECFYYCSNPALLKTLCFKNILTCNANCPGSAVHQRWDVEWASWCRNANAVNVQEDGIALSMLVSGRSESITPPTFDCDIQKSLWNDWYILKSALVWIYWDWASAAMVYFLKSFKMNYFNECNE